MNNAKSLRPIDAESLKQRLNLGIMDGFPNRIKKEIEEIIDTEPVIGTERTVSEWKIKCSIAECSFCGKVIERTVSQFYRFCPFCGSENIKNGV